MKEIRKVLEWIANKFRKATETAPEPNMTADLFEQMKVALKKMYEDIGETTDTAPEPPHEANDRPTTVMGWLDTLPDGYRELAINSARSGMDKVACTIGMASALYRGLRLWRTTGEGHGFWNAVVDHYVTGSPLPPLPQTPPNEANDQKFRIVPKDELKPMRGINSPVEPMSDKTMDAISDAFKSMLSHAAQSVALYSPIMSTREILEQELQACIASENYERCAEIKAQLDAITTLNDEARFNG